MQKLGSYDLFLRRADAESINAINQKLYTRFTDFLMQTEEVFPKQIRSWTAYLLRNNSDKKTTMIARRFIFCLRYTRLSVSMQILDKLMIIAAIETHTLHQEAADTLKAWKYNLEKKEITKTDNPALYDFLQRIYALLPEQEDPWNKVFTNETTSVRPEPGRQTVMLPDDYEKEIFIDLNKELRALTGD